MGTRTNTSNTLSKTNDNTSIVFIGEIGLVIHNFVLYRVLHFVLLSNTNAQPYVKAMIALRLCVFPTFERLMRSDTISERITLVRRRL